VERERFSTGQELFPEHPGPEKYTLTVAGSNPDPVIVNVNAWVARIWVGEVVMPDVAVALTLKLLVYVCPVDTSVYMSE
jgi:hypothetical protein